jgi:hypothetical protein
VTRRLGAFALVLLLAAAGCGGGGGSSTGALAHVDQRLVPAALSSGQLKLVEDRTAHKRFASAGAESLVADGRLWAIRDGQRLVATLQMSTLAPKVDLADKKERARLVASLLPGTKEHIEVGGVPIVQVATEDKVVYLWFGRSMFQVLQIKGRGIDPEKVLGELMAFQLASPAWSAAPNVD